MADVVCACEEATDDFRAYRSSCHEPQHKRHYRLSGRKQLTQPSTTPPPTSPPRPREQPSSDATRPSPHPNRSRDSSASAVINNAFASEDDQADICLPSVYHRYLPLPRRASPRGSMSTPPAVERATANRPDLDHSRSSAISPPSRPSTPDCRSRNDGRDYSPIAAGFARLSVQQARVDRQGVVVDSMSRGRDERPSSVDIQRRMFDGPC